MVKYNLWYNIFNLEIFGFFFNSGSSLTFPEVVKNSCTNAPTTENWIWCLENQRTKEEEIFITKLPFEATITAGRIHAFKHNHQYVFTENV